MNPLLRTGSFAGILFFVPLAILAAPAVSTASTTESTVTEPKTHTLFMGTDVVVERNKHLYRVSDVVGSSFIVAVDGTRTTIPMGGGSHNLKLEQAMRLSSVSASLANLKGERAYTPGNDPRMIRQREKMVVTQAMSDSSMVAMGQNSIARNQMVYLSSMTPEQKSDLAQWQAAVDQTQSRLEASSRSMDTGNIQLASDMTSGAAIHDRAESDMELENFDAVEISFEVSSETPLTNPYLVAITHFRPRSAAPGSVANNAIYAKELDAIGSKPQRVDFIQGGFPRGYTLENYEVHLYDHGVEIATNVAPNRVTLTREEAFLYLKIEYLSKHKGDTLPPALAMKKIYPGGSPAISSGQSSEFYFVKVSKEGIPIATFTDEACSQRADATTESLAANFRFFPAVEKGKQVDGIARVLVSKPEI